jgi:hypothetical protein
MKRSQEYLYMRVEDFDKLSQADFKNGAIRDEIRTCLKERLQLQKDVRFLGDQLERLGDFILQAFPGEPGKHGKGEGAVDVAIRLLSDYENLCSDFTRPAGV